MSAGPRLVGRDQAQAAVSGALARVRADAGQLVLVSGEPGIGKSSLLSWLADEAADCTLLRGFCWEGPGAPPYWPWTQVLRAAQLGPDDLGEAARLLDATGRIEVDGAAAAADAQFLLMEAVTEAVVAVAAQRPVVVLLDDLQWADEGTVLLLSFLARATVDRPVLVVGAYRDREAPPALLELTTAAVHVPLQGLGRGDVTAMLADLPGEETAPQVAEQLWRRSGGNPFFVRELARLLDAHAESGPSPQLPLEVIETVRRRLARLPTDCVRLLDWAAVAGREIDVDLLVACHAAPDEATVVDHLTAASTAGVVTWADPPRFTHDLYREAILAGLAAPARQRANLVIGRHLRALDRPGAAARVAAHLADAGPEIRGEAVAASVLAAQEATRRLGHEDAGLHLQRAVSLVPEDAGERAGLLLELAAAQDRAGHREAAHASLQEVVQRARSTDDVALTARAALGMQALGARSGAQIAEVVDLLREADRRLEAEGGPSALHSQVVAALTRAIRHSDYSDGGLVTTAERAVALARAADDPAVLAVAMLALHDALWAPGTAAERLGVVTDMLAAASDAADADLVAQARQLRAAALLELGDPDGRAELLAYVGLAEALGHARGRWGALTRRATYAQLAGQVDDAVRLGEEAFTLGLAIQEPDATGCFSTHRWSMGVFGVPEPDLPIDGADPLWPLFPLIRAWSHAARGDEENARRVLGSFSVLDIGATHDLERYAVAAVVFSVAGSDEQRQWIYDRLRPHAGLHVVVGGCAAYHAAVDHHLGSLARSLGEHALAERHFRDALRMHERLGAAGWSRVTEQALADLAGNQAPRPDFLLEEDRWVLSYGGRRVSLPDAKGLRDLHVLLGAPGRDVHVRDLLGPGAAPTVGRTGADPVLDPEAKAQYRSRLDRLAEELESAERAGDAERSERLEAERAALLHELAAATGLGGRDRRLGDETERARKTVGARLRDTLTRIERVHPELGAHLRASVRIGTFCAYRPDEPVSWRLDLAQRR